MFYKESIH